MATTAAEQDGVCPCAGGGWGLLSAFCQQNGAVEEVTTLVPGHWRMCHPPPALRPLPQAVCCIQGALQVNFAYPEKQNAIIINFMFL